MADALVRNFGRGGSDARVLILRFIRIGGGATGGGGDGGGVGFATINGGEPGAGHTGGGEGVGAGRCWCW